MSRILVANESKLHRVMVMTILNEVGHVTTEAVDGPSTLMQTTTLYPDLVILDWLMPGIDGIEICKRLKHDRLTRHIPILMFTFSNSPTERAQVLDIGADGYLPKPFHKEELRAIVDAALRNQHQYDPLTHLPAAPLIRNHIETRLRNGDTMAVCLLDIDHFKSYNDCYGHAAGDKVIKQLSYIIHASTNGSRDAAFIGHLGGDDFIIVCSPQNIKTVCSAIQQTFSQATSSFYNSTDRKRGYVEVTDRRGNLHRRPLMSLSITVTGNEKRTLHDYAQVHDILSELRVYARRQGGNRYVVDRRSG